MLLDLSDRAKFNVGGADRLLDRGELAIENPRARLLVQIGQETGAQARQRVQLFLRALLFGRRTA